jgi:hypothetical protein
VESGELIEELMSLCTKRIYINGSICCLKDFIGLLSTPMKYNPRYEQLFTSILKSLKMMVTNRSPRAVFTFLGTPESGIGLFGRKGLPKEGFCFCGSICIERNKHPENGLNDKMTIFKLGASRTKEIELFLKDGYLHYQVNVLLRS